jgi:hypothetical protein
MNAVVVDQVGLKKWMMKEETRGRTEMGHTSFTILDGLFQEGDS